MKFEEKSPSLSSVSFELTALHQIIGAAGTLCPPPVVIGLRLAMTLPDEYKRAALGEYSEDEEASDGESDQHDGNGVSSLNQLGRN